MKFKIVPISEEFATEILSWKYPYPYDLYNNEFSEAALSELLGGFYHAVINEFNVLTGFFCIRQAAQVPAGIPLGVYKDMAVDLGVGMRPDLTGKGLGKIFFGVVLDEIKRRFPDMKIRLTVAYFNKRALNLYKSAGFEMETQFKSNDIIFISMVKDR